MTGPVALLPRSDAKITDLRLPFFFKNYVILEQPPLLPLDLRHFPTAGICNPPLSSVRRCAKPGTKHLHLHVFLVVRRLLLVAQKHSPLQDYTGFVGSFSTVATVFVVVLLR